MLHSKKNQDRFETRLKWFLIENGIPLAEFALESGISESLLSKLTRRLVDPAPPIRRKLENVFGEKGTADRWLTAVTLREYLREESAGFKHADGEYAVKESR